LIGVTAPLFAQLIEAGTAAIYSAVGTKTFFDAVELPFKHPIWAENSAWVKSAN
jgi:hypothetical protein